jgi:hypothetical protein
MVLMMAWQAQALGFALLSANLRQGAARAQQGMLKRQAQSGSPGSDFSRKRSVTPHAIAE